MNDSHRYLNLTKTQVKTLFKTNAIDFATDSEKFEFNHFNVCNYYTIPKIKSKYFAFYENAEKYLLDNPVYKGSEIIQKFVLLMNI